MVTQLNRRAFLRGASFKRREPALRPPGALVEGFETTCTACLDCSDACPQSIIVQDKNGQPNLTFEAAACTFCSACIEACPTGALNREQLDSWDWKARVANDCISLNGVSCRVCEDFCPSGAIKFRPLTGGRFQPNIVTDACTGCGACAVVCPSHSVSFVKNSDRIETEETFA